MRGVAQSIAPRLFLVSALSLSTSCGGAPTRPAASAPAAQEAKPAVAANEAPKDNTELPPPFTTLVDRARAASREEGKPPKLLELPPSLANLDYEAYRTIRFRPEHSLWRGQEGRFEVQFFHVGLHYFEPLRISVVNDGKEDVIPFRPELFAYEGVEPPPPGVDLGFSGFRLHAPINRDDYLDEFMLFQGASYFRAVGRDQIYGLSGRGLAINTGDPGPEEFPRFTEFTLVRPAPEDTSVWVLAFLESPSATGAYAFRITPGDTTVIEVTARVFPRAEGKIFGLAPLTSMFLYGEEAPARFGGDHPNLHRPEAHDSDTLVTFSKDGEWLARQLRNPPRTNVATMRLDSPRGFGLLQRDRDQKSYLDAEYAYERRPSAWIEPLNDWGAGHVRLLEIATELESDDNIGAMWVPDSIPEDGLSLHYRAHFGRALPDGLGASVQAVSTRFAEVAKNRTRFTVELAGAPLTELSEAPEAVITARGGKVTTQKVEHDKEQGRARIVFEVAREGAGEVDLRAFLRSGTDALSETWAYLIAAKK